MASRIVLAAVAYATALICVGCKNGASSEEAARAHKDLHDKYTRKAEAVMRENDQRGWIGAYHHKQRQDACDAVQKEYKAAYEAWKAAHPDAVHSSVQTEETYRFVQAIHRCEFGADVYDGR